MDEEYLEKLSASCWSYTAGSKVRTVRFKLLKTNNLYREERGSPGSTDADRSEAKTDPTYLDRVKRRLGPGV